MKSDNMEGKTVFYPGGKECILIFNFLVQFVVVFPASTEP